MGNNYSSVPFKEGEQADHPIVLLLGNECSGKTTLIKQARFSSTIITEAERKELIPAIYSGIIQTIKDMIPPAQELGLDFDKAAAFGVISYSGSLEYPLPLTLIDNMLKIAKCEKLAVLFDIVYKYFLNDSAEQYVMTFDNAYHFSYFKSIERMVKLGYLPTDEDLLRVYQKTTAITQTEVILSKSIFSTYSRDLPVKLIDVGGSLSERDKWIDSYGEANAVIFCVSLRYDQFSTEDRFQNRILDSLKIFRGVCEWFQSIPIVVVFNKVDVFRDKIKFIDLQKTFPGFEGGRKPIEALSYIEQKFLEQRATDDQLIRTISVSSVTENKTGEIMQLLLWMLELKLLESIAS